MSSSGPGSGSDAHVTGGSRPHHNKPPHNNNSNNANNTSSGGANPNAKDRRRERQQQGLQAPEAVRAAVPRTLNVPEYTAARLTEMGDFARSMQEGTSMRRVYQTVPRHMRRRAMSHNAHRLPKKLRGPALREMAKMSKPNNGANPGNAASSASNDAMQSKYSEYLVPRATPASRRARRAPATLLRDHLRRSTRHTWLETHLWHARRMHMGSLWGHRIAVKAMDKGTRAMVRAAQAQAVSHDMSYLTCLEIAVSGAEHSSSLSSASASTNSSSSSSIVIGRAAVEAVLNSLVDSTRADAAAAALTQFSTANKAYVSCAELAADLAHASGTITADDYLAVIAALDNNTAAKSSDNHQTATLAFGASFDSAGAVSPRAVSQTALLALRSRVNDNYGTSSDTTSSSHVFYSQAPLPRPVDDAEPVCVPAAVQRAVAAAVSHSVSSAACARGDREGELVLRYPALPRMAAAKAVLQAVEAFDGAGAGAGAGFPLSSLLPLELAGQPIGPVSFMWQPTATAESAAAADRGLASDCGRLWLWVHPACAAQVAAVLSALAAAHTAVHTATATATASRATSVGGAVTVKSLAGELARIRVCGPRALSVMQNVLRAHPRTGADADADNGDGAHSHSSQARAAAAWRSLAGHRSAAPFVPHGAVLALTVTHPSALLTRQRFTAPPRPTAPLAFAEAAAVAAAAAAAPTGAVPAGATGPAVATALVTKLTTLAPQKIAQTPFAALPAQHTAVTVGGVTTVTDATTVESAVAVGSAAGAGKGRLSFEFGSAVTKFVAVSTTTTTTTTTVTTTTSSSSSTTACTVSALPNYADGNNGAGSDAAGFVWPRGVAAGATIPVDLNVSSSSQISSSVARVSTLWDSDARAILSAASPLGTYSASVATKLVTKHEKAISSKKADVGSKGGDSKSKGAAMTDDNDNDESEDDDNDGDEESSAHSRAHSRAQALSQSPLLATPLAVALLAHARPQGPEAGLGYWYPSDASDAGAADAGASARGLALVTERTRLACRINQTAGPNTAPNAMPHIRGSLSTHCLLVHRGGFDCAQPQSLPLSRRRSGSKGNGKGRSKRAAKGAAAKGGVKRGAMNDGSDGEEAAASSADSHLTSAPLSRVLARPRLPPSLRPAAAAKGPRLSLPPRAPRGFLSGWDLILPAGWGKAFFTALTHAGARAAGLDDFAALYTEAGDAPPCASGSAANAVNAVPALSAAAAVPLFPRAWPATAAGRMWGEREATVGRVEWFRSHKGRLNFWAMGSDEPNVMAALDATLVVPAPDTANAKTALTYAESMALAHQRPSAAWTASASTVASASALRVPVSASLALAERAHRAYLAIRRAARQALKNRRKRLAARAVSAAVSAAAVAAASESASASGDVVVVKKGVAVATTDSNDATSTKAQTKTKTKVKSGVALLIERVLAQCSLPRWLLPTLGYAVITSLLPSQSKLNSSKDAASARAFSGAAGCGGKLPFPLPASSPLLPFAFPPQSLLAKRSAAVLGLEELPAVPVPLDAAAVAVWSRLQSQSHSQSESQPTEQSASTLGMSVLLPVGVSTQNAPPSLALMLQTLFSQAQLSVLMPKMAFAHPLSVMTATARAAVAASASADSTAAASTSGSVSAPLLLLAPAMSRSLHSTGAGIVPTATATASAAAAAGGSVAVGAGTSGRVTALGLWSGVPSAVPAAAVMGGMADPAVYALANGANNGSCGAQAADKSCSPALASAAPSGSASAALMPPHTLPVPAHLLPALPRALAPGAWPSAHPALLTVTWRALTAANPPALAPRTAAVVAANVALSASPRVSQLFMALVREEPSWAAALLAASALLASSSVSGSINGPLLVPVSVTALGKGLIKQGAMIALPSATCHVIHNNAASMSSTENAGDSIVDRDVVCAVASDMLTFRTVAPASGLFVNVSDENTDTCDAADKCDTAVTTGNSNAGSLSGAVWTRHTVLPNTNTNSAADSVSDAVSSESAIVAAIAGAATHVAPPPARAAAASALLTAHVTSLSGPEEPVRALSLDAYLAQCRTIATDASAGSGAAGTQAKTRAVAFPAPPVSRSRIGVVVDSGFALTTGRSRATCCLVSAPGLAAAVVAAITGRPLRASDNGDAATADAAADAASLWGQGLPHPAALPESHQQPQAAGAQSPQWTVSLPADCPPAVATALAAFGPGDVSRRELAGIAEAVAGLGARGIALALPPPAVVPVLTRNVESRQYVMAAMELSSVL